MAPKRDQGKGNDIRSFFTSISPKNPPSSTSSSPSREDVTKRKKKPLKIESDSDEDIMLPTPQAKRTKPTTTKTSGQDKKSKLKSRDVTDPDSDNDSPFISPKSEVKKSSSSSSLKSKGKEQKAETPLKPVDIKSVFGDAPIQRSKHLVETKKRKLEPEDEELNTTVGDEKHSSKKSKVQSPLKSEDKQKTSGTAVKAAESHKSPKKVTPKKAETASSSKVGLTKVKAEPVDSEDNEKSEAHDVTASSPAFDPLEKRRQRAENYRRFVATHKEGAKNPGCKPIPEGAEGCLEGLKFVITGVLESLVREEADQLIKKYGGHVTSAVSSKTTHLLAGEDAGPSKLNKAKDLKINIISEDDLLNMIATRPRGSGLPSPSVKKGGHTPRSHKTKIKEEKIDMPIKKEKISPIKGETVSPAKKELVSPVKKEDTKRPPVRKLIEKPEMSQSSQPDVKEKNGISEAASLPWVEKYKPLTSAKIIGQQTDRSNAKKLAFWLQHWHENHSGHKKLTRPAPWSTNDDGAYFKAALLSGPPGIGKTTTAHLISKELGFDVVEFNASDTRSKKLLKEEVTELISCRSLASFAHGSSTMGTNKRVLIMDEVDGMAGNEDRGGIQELIALIKSSKIPIICICNDRQHVKVRSLANYCYDLKFSKPTIQQIRGAMLSICCREGISIKPEALDEIIIGANQDIRQILHHLSVLSSKNKSMSTEQAKIDANRSKKDFKLGPWDVCRKVFSAEEHQKMSLHDKTNLFFQDYSFGPLFVQENYLLVKPQAAKSSQIKTLDLIGRTADCLSQTDLIEKVIRSNNAWSLLPVEAVFASVVPGQLMEGVFTGQIQFPSWLGKHSRQNKMDRLLQELQLHTRLRISASKQSLNLDYLPQILGAIVSPLKRDGLDGVDEAVKAMESYDLMREDLDSLLELNQWPNKPDLMKGIEAKVKTAFTRAYNKEVHLPYAAGLKISKGRAKTSDELEGLEGEEELEDADEEEEDDVTTDAMIKIKKATGKKSAAAKTEPKEKATSTGRGRGANRGKGKGR